MTRIAIMQPTYLPWCGYFALMDHVDIFVLLDDVQFCPRSWQQRNRVKTSTGTVWLTVPICHTGDRQALYHVEISQQDSWRRKHLKTLKYAYGRAAFWNDYKDWLEGIYKAQWWRLWYLNSTIIEELAGLLGITTKVCFSSDLKVGPGRISRLVEICQLLGADEYLSPLGSSGYLEGDDSFHSAGIKLLYQHFEHPTYTQLYDEFVSHLSVADLLLNEGPRSLEIIRSGEGVPDVR